MTSATNLIEYAEAFVELGYRGAIFCDYDTGLDLTTVPPTVTIIRSAVGNCTEQQILHSLSVSGLAAAIQHGIDALEAASVFATLSNNGCPEALAQSVLDGESIIEADLIRVRVALGLEASKGKNKSSWFKSVTGGERLAAIALADREADKDSLAACTISELEIWGSQ